MATEPAWLGRSIIDALHERLIRDFGGSEGVRNGELIESALARPIHKWEYSGVSLPELAAAYAFGLAKNPGYIDGNKRIAATAAGVFLAMNGLELHAPEPELVHAMVAVAAGDWTEETLAAWIGDRVVPLGADPRG